MEIYQTVVLEIDVKLRVAFLFAFSIYDIERIKINSSILTHVLGQYDQVFAVLKRCRGTVQKMETIVKSILLQPGYDVIAGH